jgi:hypothetical protein
VVFDEIDEIDEEEAIWAAVGLGMSSSTKSSSVDRPDTNREGRKKKAFDLYEYLKPEVSEDPFAGIPDMTDEELQKFNEWLEIAY